MRRRLHVLHGSRSAKSPRRSGTGTSSEGARRLAPALRRFALPARLYRRQRRRPPNARRELLPSPSAARLRSCASSGVAQRPHVLAPSPTLIEGYPGTVLNGRAIRATAPFQLLSHRAVPTSCLASKAVREVQRAAQTVIDALRAVFILDPVPALMRQYAQRRDTTLSVVRTTSRRSRRPAHVRSRANFAIYFVMLPERLVAEIDGERSQLDDVMLVLRERFVGSEVPFSACVMSDGMLRPRVRCGAARGAHARAGERRRAEHAACHRRARKRAAPFAGRADRRTHRGGVAVPPDPHARDDPQPGDAHGPRCRVPQRRARLPPQRAHGTCELVPLVFLERYPQALTPSRCATRSRTAGSSAASTRPSAHGARRAALQHLMHATFVDTSILRERLRVPGKSHQPDAIRDELKDRVCARESLYLPTAAIIETGNTSRRSPMAHAAHLRGRSRENPRVYAAQQPPWCSARSKGRRDDPRHMPRIAGRRRSRRWRCNAFARATCRSSPRSRRTSAGSPLCIWGSDADAGSPRMPDPPPNYPRVAHLGGAGCTASAPATSSWPRTTKSGCWRVRSSSRRIPTLPT